MSNLQFTTLPSFVIDGRPSTSNFFTNEETSSSPASSSRSSNLLRRSSRSSKFTDSFKIDDSSLHKINRRVISKPKKNTFINGTENEIKKFYLNKKLTKIKPTCLETIFEAVNEESLAIEEENDDERNDVLASTSQVKIVGLKKLKRSLSFSDGQNISKALLQRRKKRIQTYLGGKPKVQKFTMAVFMDKLKNMHKCESDTETLENDKSSAMD